MTAGCEIAKLVEEILAEVKAAGSNELASWEHPERDIRNLARRDYAPSLQRLLKQSDLENVVQSAQAIFPNLNRAHDPMRIENWLSGPASNGLEVLFSDVTNRLDVHFQGSPFTGPEGLALRGFFIDRDAKLLKRPLIYVNTAHHPVAVAATLFHEVGHLVATKVFTRRDPGVHLFFDADYSSHLDDLEELCADTVLSLVAYPAPIATNDLCDAMEVRHLREDQRAVGRRICASRRTFPRAFRGEFGTSELAGAAQAQLPGRNDPLRKTAFNLARGVWDMKKSNRSRRPHPPSARRVSPDSTRARTQIGRQSQPYCLPRGRSA